MNKFNLILHGMMAIFEERDHLDICIPKKEMKGKPIHVAKIAQVMRKRTCISDLVSGRYKLDVNVEPNGAWQCPDAASNLILRSRKEKGLLSPCEKGIFAHLKVAKPHSHRPFRKAPIENVDDPDGVVPVRPNELSDIAVFTYVTSIVPTLTLEGVELFKLDVDAKRGVCNLIIFAEPADLKPDEHFHLFTDMVQVGGQKLNLTMESKADPAGPTPDDDISDDEQKCHFYLPGIGCPGSEEEMSAARPANFIGLNHGGCSAGYIPRATW